SGGLSARNASSSASAATSRAPPRSGALWAAGGRLAVTSSLSLIEMSVGRSPNASTGARLWSRRSTLFGRGPELGGWGGAVGFADGGVFTGCNGGRVSVPLDAGADSCGRRLPLRRRLTVG